MRTNTRTTIKGFFFVPSNTRSKKPATPGFIFFLSSMGFTDGDSSCCCWDVSVTNGISNANSSSISKPLFNAFSLLPLPFEQTKQYNITISDKRNVNFMFFLCISRIEFCKFGSQINVCAELDIIVKIGQPFSVTLTRVFPFVPFSRWSWWFHGVFFVFLCVCSCQVIVELLHTLILAFLVCAINDSMW